ncbi:MAG: DUF2489 domain-containing protein [Thalassolituus sp.]
MPELYIYLLVAAILIVVPLSGYAWHLTRKVKDMEEQAERDEAEAELNLRNYQQELISDIRFVARSVVQQQCDITEGVMRLHYLIGGLDPDVWSLPELESLKEHHDATRNMPILDAYKALSKKEQFRLDTQRLQLEAENKASIERALIWLSDYHFPQVTLLQ